MNSQLTDGGSGDSGNKCRLCYQTISSSAKVCHSCGRDQRWLVRNFPVAAVVSIALLVLSTWQFIEASDALDQAREARQATHEAAMSTAEIVLATLAVDQGRFADFEAKRLTAPFVRRKIERIFDTLELTTDEREMHLRIYRAYGRWMDAPENSAERRDAWTELEHLTGEDAA